MGTQSTERTDIGNMTFFWGNIINPCYFDITFRKWLNSLEMKNWQENRNGEIWDCKVTGVCYNEKDRIQG